MTITSGRNKYGYFAPDYDDDTPQMVECQLCGKLMAATAGINTIWWGKRVHADCHRKLKKVKPRQEEATKNLRVYKKFLEGKVNYQMKFKFKLVGQPIIRKAIKDITTLIIGILLSVSYADAGFIRIDSFTNPRESDGLGYRSYNGTVQPEPPLMSMIAGTPVIQPISKIHYSFLPSPLVVKPIFVLKVKNAQTSYLETGIIRASINGGPTLQQTLYGDQSEFINITFDFTNQVPASSTISVFRLDWLRPDNTTGVRQLLIDNIDVVDVPEPPTYALLAVCFSTIGIYQLHRIQSHKNNCRVNAKRFYRN